MHVAAKLHQPDTLRRMSGKDAKNSPATMAAFITLVAFNIVLMWLVISPIPSRRHLRAWAGAETHIIAQSVSDAAQREDQRIEVRRAQHSFRCQAETFRLPFT